MGWGDKVVGELMRGILERRINKKGRTWKRGLIFVS
jgi:hypothetical protein